MFESVTAKSAAGAIIGALALFVLYVLIMWAYIASRKKFSGAKYAVELFYIALVFLFSFVIKCAIFSANESDTFGKGLVTIFYAIYSSIGGLEFEGLSSPGEVGSVLVQWLYSGSSVLAGLVFFSIILTRISYEMYSGVLLFFLRLRLKTDTNTDVYLFTSVTPDSLLLANSINEKRLDDKKEYKKALKEYKKALKEYKKGKREGKDVEKPEKVRKSKIVFAGDDIGSFDRKNPLHREIMSNGYMFWSYSKKTGDKESSMLKRLGLYIDNVFFEINPQKNESEKEERGNKKIVVKAKAKNSRIHVFAMHNDENFSGEETVNTEIVFTEIETVAKEIAEYNKKPVFVDYYILTNRDVNYTYYDNYKKKCVKSGVKSGLESAKKRPHRKNHAKAPVLKKDTIEVCNQRGQVCDSEFALHIINEPDISAKLFADARNNHWDTNSLIQDTGEANYNVMVVGFGATGQRTMLQSYVMSAKIDDRKPNYHMPTQFRADVFDKETDSVSGIFELQHPLIVCVNDKGVLSQEEIERQIEKKRREKINMTYHSVVGKKMNLPADRNGENPEATIEDIENQMKLPVVVVHNASCFGSDYIDYLDSITGVEKPVEDAKTGAEKPAETSVGARSRAFNLIIVALGKDEDNIKMANALLADIKHELNNPRNPKSAKLQTIAINILNKKNRDRINWNDDDAARYGNLKVIVYGGKDDIYSYKQIIDEDEHMRYKYAYAMIDDEQLKNSTKEMSDNFDKGTTPQKRGGYFDALCTFNTKVENENKERLRTIWKEVPLAERESNASAALFVNVIRAMTECYCTSAYTYEEVRLLAELEHERWNRSYIAGGWTFNQKMPVKQEGETDKQFEIRRKDAKQAGKDRNEHDCLLPFSMLDNMYNAYDMVNVARVFESDNPKK